MSFQYDVPATLEGRVIESSIRNPNNSIFSNEKDVYSIVIELENLDQFYELESLFISMDHPHLPTKGDWNVSTGVVRASSLIAPRVRTEIKGSEYQVGDLVLIDVRPMCNTLAESLFETLVLISARSYQEEEVEAEIVEDQTVTTYDW